MLRTVGDKLKHWAAVAAFAALTLTARHVTNWSWSAPIDPTQSQALQLGPTRPPPGYPPSPAIVHHTEDATTWEVAFVTARALPELGGSQAEEVALIHGLTEVTIPRWRTRGSLKLPPRDRTVPKSDELIRAPARALTSEDFYERLHERLASTAERNVLVFVHGYNVTFDESVCRLAQMAHDMPFSGVVVAFDWESKHGTLGYFHDSWTAQTRYQDLSALLAGLRRELGESTRIHLLAHSMGNRVALRALLALEHSQAVPIGAGPVNAPHHTLLDPQYPGWPVRRFGEKRPPPLGHLVFAAADVAPEVFQEILPQIDTVAQSITLYSSETDFALELSRIVNLKGKHGYRSGDSRAGVQAARLTTIHLSGVNPADPFGHSYYGSHPGLLSDLAQLLQKNLPPERRPTLTAGSWSEAGEWRLR